MLQARVAQHSGPGGLIPWALIGAVALVLLVLAGIARSSRALRVQGPSTRGRPEEVHRVETADGWHLQISRYRGDGIPVLVCHGIASCGRNMDLTGDRSITRALHARGHDVWLLDLRGCGGSRQGPEDAAAITFDDFVHQDGPAAMAHVLAETQARAVDWVGFSMGGIVGTALLGGPCGHMMRTLTLIGTPVRMGRDPLFGQLASAAMGLFRWRGAVPLRALSRLAARLPGWLVRPFIRTLTNPRNVAWAPMRLAMDQSVEDIPTGLLDQMNSWRQNEGGHAASRDRGIDYVQRLEQAPPIPLMCVAGTGDRLGPVMAALPALRLHRGPRHLRLVGRGATEQAARWAPPDVKAEVRELAERWSHVDLVIGADATTEVFEPVGDFLASAPS